MSSNQEEFMVSVEEARDWFRSQGFVYVHPEYLRIVRLELWRKKQVQVVKPSESVPVS
jgi:hypothetical protein